MSFRMSDLAPLYALIIVTLAGFAIGYIGAAVDPCNDERQCHDLSLIESKR